MSQRSADVIVAGLGGMGSATAHELARRGKSVLGFDQFGPVHDQGSSHGNTRIIRRAYFEHPDYVPLVERAYSKWYAFEQLSGTRVLTECPCLTIGADDSDVVTGVRQSAKEHGLPIEDLDNKELTKRYPAFRPKKSDVGVVELTAGYLAVEECVRANLQLATELGADLHYEEPIRSWTANDREVRVQTSKGMYRADRLVITAGPWAKQLLSEVADGITLMRQVVFWFQPQNPTLFRRDVFPIFITDTGKGYYYGLPMLDPAGVKVARHYGAREVRLPTQIRRTLSNDEPRNVRSFINEYLPDAKGKVGRSSVCIYTLTKDRHFLIDIHPDHERIVFGVGFSGHGFKFAPVVGEALADLALEGTTELPISRFAIR